MVLNSDDAELADSGKCAVPPAQRSRTCATDDEIDDSLEPCGQCGSNNWILACRRCTDLADVKSMSDITAHLHKDADHDRSAREARTMPDMQTQRSLSVRHSGGRTGSRPTYLPSCQGCQECGCYCPIRSYWMLGCQHCGIRWRLCCMGVVFCLVNADSERHGQDTPCDNCKDMEKYASHPRNVWHTGATRRVRRRR